MNRRQPKRAGYMLLTVLACLSLVMALTVAAVRTALRMRREVMKQHTVTQVVLLCEAGLTRAATRQRDPEYSGETWRPAMPEHPGKQIEVSIVFLKRSPTRSTVQVTAVIEDLQTMTSRVQRSIVTSLDSNLLSEVPKRENR